MRANRRRSHGRDRAARPVLEGLEDRFLLYATSGGSWMYPVRISYSFAPDGTNIGGDSSNLFGAMSKQGFTTTAWQQAFQQAAAAWAAVTNINLAQVPDDGSTFGTDGNQQDDPRFGDIRIGGDSTLSPGVLAGTFLPPPYNGGTLAGDIVMNTSQNFSSSGYDLLTVAVHEFGHALGMSHSQITSAVMYADYTSTKQSLSSDDIAGIKTIYGNRQPDAFDAAGWGNTLSTAYNLTPYLNSQGQLQVTGLDITTNGDSDIFYIQAPATTTGTMYVAMQSTNLSSLSPKFALYNSSGYAFFSYAAPSSYGTTLSVNVSGVQPGQGYYIRAMTAGGGSSGVGGYGLEFNFGSSPMGPIQPPNTVVTQKPDQGGGSANETTGGGTDSGQGLLGGGLLGGLLGGISQTTSQLDNDLISIGQLQAAGDYLTVGDLTPTPAQPQSQPQPQPHADPFAATQVFDAGPVVVVTPDTPAVVVPGQHDRTTRATDAVLANWS